MNHANTFYKRFINYSLIFLFILTASIYNSYIFLSLTIAIVFLLSLYIKVLMPLYTHTQNVVKQLNTQLDHEQEKSKTEMNEKNKILTQQSKLAIMGEMLSMIAHQWRQPLSTISTLSATMMLKIQMNKHNDEQITKSLKKIELQTKYLSETISDFSNFFQPDKRKSSVYLQSIIVKSIRILSKSLEDSNILVLENYEIENNIEIYHNELMQVIINIIKNADDALKENKIQNPVIDINVNEIDNNQIITIEDNAGGIPTDIIEQVFNPYFSTKDKNGTGIGLYMSKIIIEKHLNGEIKVENSKSGAKFSITLPL